MCWFLTANPEGTSQGSLARFSVQGLFTLFGAILVFSFGVGFPLLILRVLREALQPAFPVKGCLLFFVMFLLSVSGLVPYC